MESSSKLVGENVAKIVSNKDYLSISHEVCSSNALSSAVYESSLK
jgi:hypothetical protein